MNDIVNKLMIENELLKKKNLELEEKLKTYTNTERHKRYYENNSEKVKEKAKLPSMILVCVLVDSYKLYLITL
jgi:hypothetical protein